MTLVMPSGVELIFLKLFVWRSDLRDANASTTRLSDKILGGSEGRISMKMPCKITTRFTMYAAKTFAVESLCYGEVSACSSSGMRCTYYC
jgi:hypothetical protein